MVPNSFKDVLHNFFPRYVEILSKPEYRNDIAEIRIEGHTSSEWFSQVTGDEAYINNMELSQNRARNVLHYVMEIAHPEVNQNRAWLKKQLTANGLSSSQLILNLAQNYRVTANLYTIVATETGIPEHIVRHLHPEIHREIKNWHNNDILTREDIAKTIGTVQIFSSFRSEVLERAVGLLMENKEDSRRVEFRVVTKSEKLINEIEQLMKRFNKSEVVH